MRFGRVSCALLLSVAVINIVMAASLLVRIPYFLTFRHLALQNSTAPAPHRGGAVVEGWIAYCLVLSAWCLNQPSQLRRRKTPRPLKPIPSIQRLETSGTKGKTRAGLSLSNAQADFARLTLLKPASSPVPRMPSGPANRGFGPNSALKNKSTGSVKPRRAVKRNSAGSIIGVTGVVTTMLYLMPRPASWLPATGDNSAL